MGQDEVVAHPPDLLRGQGRGGVGVHEHRLAHQARVSGPGGLDGEFGDRDVGAVVRGGLHRQGPHRHRVDAVPVDQGGDLDDAAGGQVVHQPWFTTLACTSRGVPVTREWMTCGAYSVAPTSSARVPPAASVRSASSNSRTFSSEICRYSEAAGEPLDLLVRAQEPGEVLRGVLARLRRVVPDPAEHLDADPALELGVGGDARAQGRVQVAALVRPLQQPRLGGFPRGAEAGPLDRDADELGEVVRGPVHAVAQAEGRQVGGDDVQPPHVHRHRVRVVQDDGPGGDVAHVRREGGQEREGAQGPNTPPTPVVSPMVCRRPYRAGISRSRRVASMPRPAPCPRRSRCPRAPAGVGGGVTDTLLRRAPPSRSATCRAVPSATRSRAARRRRTGRGRGRGRRNRTRSATSCR